MPDRTGICGVRQNINGDLHLLVYGKAAALQVDPIEKKPLYHFMPKTKILSIGTVGCNFKCSFCQNADLSQEVKFKESNLEPQLLGQNLPPEQLIEIAINNNLPSIAYTYNEPTIFTEYALDVMVLARKKGLKNVWVSNGYMSKEIQPELFKYLDAINIDLKSFSEKFYKTICGAHLQPILENIKTIFDAGIHLEITTLIIEGLNDSNTETALLTKFISSISPEIPWHISRFFPDYKMLDRPVTNLKTLERVKEIGKKSGLKNIYIGNI